MKIVNSEFTKVKRINEKGEIKSIEYIDKHLKYDRLACQSCRYYQYISIFKCMLCHKKYCFDHIDKCCGKGFIYLTR